MSINRSSPPAYPDYELADRLVVTGRRELKAMSDPLRSALLELTLERAATVTELAAAVARPKSTIAHHVNVLVDAGMLKVVRTRRVRAIEERFYGRTARLFYIGRVDADVSSDIDAAGRPPWTNPFADAAAESDAAYRTDTLWANARHVRIPRAAAGAFWPRVQALLDEFAQLPRAGDEVFGLMAGLYPTDFPALGEPPSRG